MKRLSKNITEIAMSGKFFRFLVIISIITTLNIIVPEKSFSNPNILIESIRSDSVAVICSYSKPEKSVYNIMNTKDATCTVLSFYKTGDIYKITVRIDKLAAGNLKPGGTIELAGFAVIPDINQRPKKDTLKIKYKKSIITKGDVREMVFIDESYFYFGGNNDGKLSLTYCSSFYIDTCEVSNEDYLRYVESAKKAYPISWGGNKPETGVMSQPVIVSYSEADNYAKWAGKRLPTETEWEKAASGSTEIISRNINGIYLPVLTSTVYSWGNSFNAEKSISMPFWLTPKGKEFLQKNKQGLNSVYDQYGVSAFGLLNCIGNAPEWTSTWYEAKENNKNNKFYSGKQVKIIKGGSWYSSKNYLNISAREFGGFPNLDEDSIAGFRCVKDITEEDKE